MALYSLGIQQLMQDLTLMSVPGAYWLNVNNSSNAGSFCQQVITALPATAQAALIYNEVTALDLLDNLGNAVIKRLPCYVLTEKKSAALAWVNELGQVFNYVPGLAILLVNARLWDRFNQAEFIVWIRLTAAYLVANQLTLLILAYGPSVDKIQPHLISQWQSLNGLAQLTGAPSSAQYLLNWWGTETGIIAKQSFPVSYQRGQWSVDPAATTAITAATQLDDMLYLAEKNILEGAPPLSENWQLFADNASLVTRGERAQAATLIFAFAKANEVEELAQAVHHLRLKQGNNLKIVIRELDNTLRYSDEQLLLACGANIVVPQTISLPRFLHMLIGVRTQTFKQTVPTELAVIMAAARAIQLKGQLAPAEFVSAIEHHLANSLTSQPEKGVLIALQPVPGIKAQQTLSLCCMKRFGDIITVSQAQCYIFLSNCHLNDIKTALDNIFQLPFDEIFSSYIAWHQEWQILAEIRHLIGATPFNETERVSLEMNHLPTQQPVDEVVVTKIIRREPTEIILR